jgi:hypothetical protein
MREPVEVVGCFLGGLADDRYVQSAADHASDVSERHALFGDPMIPRSCGTFLKRQPEQMGSIKPVHGGPAIEPVTHIRRNALLTRETDEERNEGVITVAVDGWRKAYHRHAHATRRHQSCCLFRSDAGDRRAGSGHIFFDREATPFGLGCGVWTRDVCKAHRLAKAIRAGSVRVNCYQVMDPAVPFGGYKMSGYGRKSGLQHLDEYLNVKAVWIKTA